MINYYQPFLLPFLSLKKTPTRDGIRRLYYHSFEDALWDLLAQKHVPKGASILIPNFYCMDVVENMKHHGYVPVFYPLDRQFQIQRKLLESYIRRIRPAVIILFHACGITCRVLTRSFVQAHADSIVLEDCVQRLINPSEIAVYGENHFVIDSLRKVSSIPGSFIYGTAQGLSYTGPQTQPYPYILRSFFWFFLFRALLSFSVLSRWSRGALWAHETLLKRHDDIVGDSMLPAAGFAWIGNIQPWFNFKRISAQKMRQADLYTEVSRTLPSPFYPIRIPPSDRGNLHVYPLGMVSMPHRFISYLHSQSIAVWCKFEDAPWAKKSHVLFLPLGFHVSDREIQYTVDAIRRFSAQPSSPAS